MKQLSSNLSKPRRRIYGLLMAGALAAGIAAAVGALIVGLGHGNIDVTIPFWECGEYVLLLGLFNLGVYAAIFWQVGRLTRREGRGPVAAVNAPPYRPEPIAAPPVEHVVRPPPAAPVQVSRRVRGTVASLKLEP